MNHTDIGLNHHPLGNFFKRHTNLQRIFHESHWHNQKVQCCSNKVAQWMVGLMTHTSRLAVEFRSLRVTSALGFTLDPGYNATLSQASKFPKKPQPWSLTGLVENI